MWMDLGLLHGQVQGAGAERLLSPRRGLPRGAGVCVGGRRDSVILCPYLALVGCDTGCSLMMGCSPRCVSGML